MCIRLFLCGYWTIIILCDCGEKECFYLLLSVLLIQNSMCVVASVRSHFLHNRKLDIMFIAMLSA